MPALATAAVVVVAAAQAVAAALLMLLPLLPMALELRPLSLPLLLQVRQTVVVLCRNPRLCVEIVRLHLSRALGPPVGSG